MEETQDFIILDAWNCGDRVSVEQRFWLKEEKATISTKLLDREPPGWKTVLDMYSCHTPNQSILPENAMWSFEEAEKEFERWLNEIEGETLEQNPERELDLYLIEMYQYMFLHPKVRGVIKGFSTKGCPLTTFRKLVLARHQDVALVFKED